MSRGDLRRRCCVGAMMGLILLGTAMRPAPALSDMIQYTYTGSPLSLLNQASPSPVGNNITIVFNYDGFLPAGQGGTLQGNGDVNLWDGVPIGSFVISCGPALVPWGNMRLSRWSALTPPGA